MRPLRVGMDLDGVNFWFDRSYYWGCRMLGLIPAGVGHVRATRWQFYEDYEHDTARFLANCHRLADEGLLWSGPMIPGASTMWDALCEAGHEIHVITDRPFGTHPVASHVGTRMWLDQHNRGYDSITFTADKTLVATDIMLEDKLENYDALEAAGAHPVLINRPWNAVRGGDTRRRIDLHDEFVALAEQRAAELGCQVAA